MPIDPRTLSADATYRLMTGIVVPRPIAWISTISAAGVANLAPFSCFTFLSNKPALVGVNIGRKAGRRKDTAVNISGCGEFVVNIGDASQMEAINESSAEFAPDVSEVELLGLPTVASDVVKAPRLRDVPVSLECRLERVIPFGDTGSEFFVGEVLVIHVRDGLVRDGKIDTRALNPVCRIAGPNYATLGEIVTLRAIQHTPKSVVEAGH